MSTIIVISKPPKRAPKHAQSPIHDAREFDVPDDLNFADSLRYIADQVEAEE